MNPCGTASGRFGENQRLQNEKRSKTPNALFQITLQIARELTDFIPPSPHCGIFLKKVHFSTFVRKSG
jgi:hypothetical protein